MVEIGDLLNQMQITRPDHLPVVAAFSRRIGLIDFIFQLAALAREALGPWLKPPSFKRLLFQSAV